MNRYKPLFTVVLIVFLLGGVSLVLGKEAGTAMSPPEQSSSIPVGSPEGWQIQTVATRGNTGIRTDLVLDANGYPHVSFIEVVSSVNGSVQLHYAYWDGIRWHQELVDNNLLDNEVFDITSIDLDANGYPHIVYTDATNLQYAYWDGTTWQTETVEDSAETITQPSFQLDSNDRPHISYHKGSELAYAYKDEATWHTEIVDTGYTGNFNSLALDAENHPHISYVDVGSNVLMYAAYDGISWLIQTVDGSESIYSPTSLALTTSGSPRISYVAISSGNLKYASSTGKGWQIETLATLPADTTHYAALALDSNDTPHVVYSAIGSKGSVPLTHLYPVDGSWQSEILDSSSDRFDIYNALVVDAENHIHASYREGNYNDLRYVTWDSNWITRTVEAPAAIQATSLQLSQGNPHISYYNLTDADVKLIGWQEAWTQVPMPKHPVSDQVHQTSLAFTSSRIHMSYSVSGYLIYLVWDGQDWDVQLVDSSATVGDYNQILALGDKLARIAYWDEVNFRVKLAELQLDNTWEIHTNTAGPKLDANSGYLSATILSKGKIGISYYDGIQGDLRLAVWDPATGLWTDELIDGTFAYTGLLSALQTDGTTGSPVVAYYNGIGGTIYFAYKEGESWHIEPAAPEVGSVTSLFLELGLNSYARPRIAFTTNAGALAVASKQAGNWVVEPVVSSSPALDNVSMTISDRPHLAYTDTGLYYAFRSATLDVDSVVPGASAPTGGAYNPTDACAAVLQLFIEGGTGLMAQPPDASLGSTTPLEDMAIFEGMNVLFAASPGGGYYIDLYGQHGSEMGQIALDDPQLLWDSYGTLQNFLPGLEALVTGQGENMLVTQEMVDDALDVWQRIAAVASPTLAATINAELVRYNNLQDFVGLTFAEWITALGVAAPVNPVYLPLITNNP